MAFGNECVKQSGVMCKRGPEAPHEGTASLVCRSIVSHELEA